MPSVFCWQKTTRQVASSLAFLFPIPFMNRVVEYALLLINKTRVLSQGQTNFSICPDSLVLGCHAGSSSARDICGGGG